MAEDGVRLYPDISEKKGMPQDVRFFSRQETALITEGYVEVA